MTRHRKRKRKRRHSRRGGAKEREEAESEEEEEESEPASQRPKRNQQSEISSLPASLSGASSKVTDSSLIKKSSVSPQTATVSEGPVTSQKEFTEYKDDEQGKCTFRTQTHPDVVAWQQRVQEWYPQLFQQTYFLPSVFMHRMQLKEKQAAGQEVLEINAPLTEPKVTGGILDKDVREDRAHQKVLDCLQELSSEVMFVISQLQFGNYLGEPAYAAAARLFPRPHDPVLASQNKDQGDFDILVIHKHYGVLVGEIKSIGDSSFDVSLSQEQQDATLMKRVKEATKQLTKSRDVLKYIVPCDGCLQTRIQTTLMLPNITASQLSRALSGCKQARMDLCEVLGVDSYKDPASLCLTSDDLKNPGPWWSRVVTSSGADPAIFDSVYLDLVARFCGPATTVTVHCPSLPRRAANQRSSLRSTGDGVAETARRFAPSDIMLHPEQVTLLNAQQRLVYVAGPPGTGKTVVLVLKAMEWLRLGKRVHVVSTHPDSLAASHMIVAQLKEAVDKREDKISLCVCDLTKTDNQEASSELENWAENGELYVIADEVYTSRNLRKDSGKFRFLCNELTRRLEGLHFWAASVYHGRGPSSFEEVFLTEPLRSPPRVTREIQDSGFFTSADVLHYKTPSGPLPTEGPAIVSLLHEGDGHSTGTPYECEECGKRIAKTLMELGVCPSENPTSTSTKQVPLRCRDVFILTGDHGLPEFRPDTASKTPSGLLRGVEEAGVPLTLVKEDDVKAIEAVATMTGPDRVVVAQSNAVSGLERPVVVWVQGDKESHDEHDGRLNAMSRATAQLIWVRKPP